MNLQNKLDVATDQGVRVRVTGLGFRLELGLRLGRVLPLLKIASSVATIRRHRIYAKSGTLAVLRFSRVSKSRH